MNVLVLGHRGLVGSAVCRRLRAPRDGEPAWRVLVDSKRRDLRSRDACELVFSEADRHQQIHALVIAAARVGGIRANATEGYDFLRDNLLIQLNVIEAARRYNMPRVASLGSACMSPRDAAYPHVETDLGSGRLEPTNAPYALAKLAGLELMQQVGRPAWVTLVPANVYGPGDNFDLERSHVVPALIRKVIEAQERREPFTVWGNGSATRELLYVGDLADAIVRSLLCEASGVLNIGSGHAVTVASLVSYIRQAVGGVPPRAEFTDDTQGATTRMLDSQAARSLGLHWQQTPLAEGLRQTIEWYREQRARGFPNGRESAQ